MTLWQRLMWPGSLPMPRTERDCQTLGRGMMRRHAAAPGVGRGLEYDADPEGCRVPAAAWSPRPANVVSSRPSGGHPELGPCRDHDPGSHDRQMTPATSAITNDLHCTRRPSRSHLTATPHLDTHGQAAAGQERHPGGTSSRRPRKAWPPGRQVLNLSAHASELPERLPVNQQSAFHLGQDRSHLVVLLLCERCGQVLPEPVEILANDAADLLIARGPRQSMTSLSTWFRAAAGSSRPASSRRHRCGPPASARRRPRYWITPSHAQDLPASDIGLLSACGARMKSVH